MEYILDVHLHTVLSGHANSTVLENAEYARQKGLKFMGMADHAPGLPGGAHLYNFGLLWSIPDYLLGVRVFKGVEANIMDFSGKLDLPDKLLGKMDFVIASLHSGVLETKSRQEHTDAVVAAMENRNVHVIGHPGSASFELDMEQVVAAAARTRTVLEVNNQSLNPKSHRYNGDDVLLGMLALCKKHRVPVLASSDAHICVNVGEFSLAKCLIERAGIGEDMVLNTSGDRFLAAIDRKRSLE